MSHKLWRRLAACFIAFVALAATATVAMAGDCDSVPNANFTIAPPASSAGAAAAFSGTWQGLWTVEVARRNPTGNLVLVRGQNSGGRRHNATYCARLHVSVTSAQGATVLYCTGDLPEANIKAGCAKHEATIAGNDLGFTTGMGVKFAFSLAGSGSLRGRYDSFRGPRFADFQKMP